MTGLLVDVTKKLQISTCSTVVKIILLYLEQTNTTESTNSGRSHHSLQILIYDIPENNLSTK